MRKHTKDMIVVLRQEKFNDITHILYKYKKYYIFSLKDDESEIIVSTFLYENLAISYFDYIVRNGGFIIKYSQKFASKKCLVKQIGE